MLTDQPGIQEMTVTVSEWTAAQASLTEAHKSLDKEQVPILAARLLATFRLLSGDSCGVVSYSYHIGRLSSPLFSDNRCEPVSLL
ncbi:hypothetical protein P4I20_08435 [Paenibacillus graminis]